MTFCKYLKTLKTISFCVAAFAVSCPAFSGPYDNLFVEPHREFHDWVPACDVDRITQIRFCTLTKVLPETTFYIHASGSNLCVSPAINDHPGAVAYVRVDSTVHRYRDEIACGATAKAILKSMATGRQIAVRTTHWPAETIEFVLDLEGFGPAYKAFQLEVRRLKPR